MYSTEGPTICSKTRFLFFYGVLYLLIVSVYSQNVTLYGNEGDSIKLNCPLTPPESGRTDWKGPPSLKVYFYNTDKDPNVLRPERLSVMNNTVSGAYDLLISNIVNGVDDGNYGCIVNTKPAQEYFINLKFNVPVKTISLQPDHNPLPIIEGSMERVECVVNEDAAPPPVFIWYLKYKDKERIIERNTTFLNIMGNRTDNSKTLECQSTNNNETPKTASTLLNIEYPPSLNALSQQNVLDGSNLTVSCTATPGNPSSTTFYWTMVDKSGFRQNGSTLQLYNIQRTSSGTYRCIAENNFSNGIKGNDTEEMFINVQYPPLVIALDDKDIIEERDLSVNCTAIAGNPNFTTFYWTKIDNPGFRQNSSTLQIRNINRTSSGTYKCTAENTFSDKAMGTHSQRMKVNVLYPPTVSTLSQQDIIEGRNLSVTCNATSGNPNSTSFFWAMVNNQGVRQNRSTLHLYNIQRNSSGTYKCTAQNSYSGGEKGTNSQPMVVNVLYQPTIEHKPLQIVNESEAVKLTREISSNPVSNAFWYDKMDLLKSELSVTTTTFNIKNATCTDAKNFTLVVQNKVGNDTALVGLIVNCKPRSYKTDFTLGVTDTTGIDFSTIVIAYPDPLIKLVYENGSVPDRMMTNISRNAVNNFTIHISQSVVSQSDFGVYHLTVKNMFGEITVIVNVIPRRKPNMPDNIKIVCEETRANVQWKSSFNGGDPQLFTVFASSGQQSNNISDRGENVIHSTYVQHLQPSTMYVFYVSAQNSHGLILSEKISCTTLAESSEKFPIIVGSAAAGGLTLVVVVVVVVFLFRRFTNTEKQAGNSQRFENDLVENESVDDDGLKDNILYVSADPRENEKHEAAVYADVNKKDPMGNNNSNVYAEVKKNGIKDVKEGAIYSDVKPKKGFFTKGGKVKKEKRQKRKQEVADVYENSDDIAMTANPDNVYSNTNHNNDSAKEQRGYKNKDGLLYVEVKFDTKTEERNPVIHGDDEKTDYATVEFPVPSSSHDRE